MKFHQKLNRTAKTAVAIALSSFGVLDMSSLDNVTQSIENIRILSSQKNNINFVFLNVKELSKEIENISQAINANLDKVNIKEFNHLVLINQLINFSFYMLKNEYKTQILSNSEYKLSFRYFSNAKNNFENSLQRIKENINGVDVVTIKDISLSECYRRQYLADSITEKMRVCKRAGNCIYSSKHTTSSLSR
ncbi:hypothetical protein APJL_1874 [Actinobacillus pleuropneumoniae serovar 3 str. JL03]|uniref:Uncharacterized protein n=1 Tax=Actinobacillus pleuropneumoniae serotype 3 (strain JL03) TaxID=434271 RepID=B0BT10_ACTPJ|nr:hypothetical protein [Actinobacillus pleuropneumoniae]ABY70424.1 hypothetical protein APJL_1874 [Actinobacillus pleuropneumoniae serovar 3 str. JL03]